MKSSRISSSIATDQSRHAHKGKSPLYLPDAWRAVERRIRRADRIAFFTDFDGTLAPLAHSPNHVQLGQVVRRSLTSIAHNGVVVGVISGRKISDIQTRVGVRGIWYVGAHGYYLRRPGISTLCLLTPLEKTEMSLIRRRLVQRLRGIPGIMLEPKQATMAIHYRQASRQSCRTALAIIEELLLEYPHLRLLHGKKVWELLPASQISKWTAIRRILDFEKGKEKTRWLVFYLGDDITDEMVFSKMRGISIAVGKRRRTAAAFFLDSTREVPAFLEKLCESLKPKSPGEHFPEPPAC
ncbi:MAG: trehalose-phosphatase [Acidobacteria bacterium]|nr:trehalose-phosphatase [Acidobacteriota bacterium]